MLEKVSPSLIVFATGCFHKNVNSKDQRTQLPVVIHNTETSMSFTILLRYNHVRDDVVSFANSYSLVRTELEYFELACALTHPAREN